MNKKLPTILLSLLLLSIIIFIGFITFFTVYSESEDDDKIENDESKFYGTWEYVEFEYMPILDEYVNITYRITYFKNNSYLSEMEFFNTDINDSDITRLALQDWHIFNNQLYEKAEHPVTKQHYANIYDFNFIGENTLHLTGANYEEHSAIYSKVLK